MHTNLTVAFSKRENKTASRESIAGNRVSPFANRSTVSSSDPSSGSSSVQYFHCHQNKVLFFYSI